MFTAFEIFCSNESFWSFRYQYSFSFDRGARQFVECGGDILGNRHGPPCRILFYLLWNLYHSKLGSLSRWTVPKLEQEKNVLISNSNRFTRRIFWSFSCKVWVHYLLWVCIILSGGSISIADSQAVYSYTYWVSKIIISGQ